MNWRLNVDWTYPFAKTQEEWDMMSKTEEEKTTVIIDYTNYRNERSHRRIVPISLNFTKSKWHPDKQWLLEGFDTVKRERREFAMKDIHSWTTP